MLFAQISTRLLKQHPDKRRGDVLLVKPAWSVFSIEEHRIALIVEWKDDLLEESMNEAVLVHPYSLMDERSTRWLDVEAMAEAGLILDPDEIVPVLPWSTVAPYVREGRE